MSLVLSYYDKSLEALEKGADIEKLASLASREAIGRFKYVHEEDIENEYNKVISSLDSEISRVLAEKEAD